MKWNLFTLLSMTLLVGCGKSIDKKIASHIDKTCYSIGSDSSCIIDLEEVLNFEWDNMYVFESMAMPEEISQKIGFDCKCEHVKDNFTKVLFTKGNKIVYQSQFYSLDGKVQFRPINLGEDIINYSKSAAKFLVYKEKKKMQNEYFYDLFPVNN